MNKNKRKIFLLSGFSGSGKDTIADILVKYKNFKKIAFADELKKLASIITEIKINNFYDITVKNNYRHVLIDISKHEKEKDKLIFVKPIINMIKKNKNINYVISDLRYEEELIKMKKEFPNCIAVWIDREINNEKCDDIKLRKKDCDSSLPNNSSINESEIIKFFE